MKILSGDIITPDNFHWSLENKTGYDIDIINLFSADQGKKTDRTLFYSFLDQAARDAERANMPPMVIYTKDFRPPLAILPTQGHDQVNILNQITSLFKSYMYIQYKLKKIDKWNNWIIIDLMALFKYAPLEFFFVNK